NFRLLPRLMFLLFIIIGLQANAQHIITVAGTGTAGFNNDSISGTNAQINNPSDVVVDKAGNLYIADKNNHRVRKIGTTGTITTYAGTGAAGFSGDGNKATAAQLRSPVGLALDTNGNLYI